MAMLLHSSDEVEFTRITSSRNRSSGVRVQGRRSVAVNQAAIEQRKQRSRSRRQRQRIRSKAWKSDRDYKWVEHHTWDVTEDNPINPPPLLEELGLVEVARFNGGYQLVPYIDGNRCRGGWKEAQHFLSLESHADHERRLTLEEWHSSEGGYSLVVDPATRVAALQRYESRDGCPSCDHGRLSSEDGLNNELESALKDAVSCGEMYRRARSCVDPKMHLRRKRAGDLGYDAVSALYASYLLFHEQTLTPMARQRCTEWKCRTWSKRSVTAVVKFQALWRGWHFRRRILFSPHINLGRLYLQHLRNRFPHDSLSKQSE